MLSNELLHRPLSSFLLRLSSAPQLAAESLPGKPSTSHHLRRPFGPFSLQSVPWLPHIVVVRIALVPRLPPGRVGFPFFPVCAPASFRGVLLPLSPELPAWLSLPPVCVVLRGHRRLRSRPSPRRLHPITHWIPNPWHEIRRIAIQ